MAAALGNVDARDNWKIHFRDTMRGGKFLNEWRMAELHARQAPERVRELEEWGAVFDRTKDGLISQRNFGGHRYPRLAHVGDRTGLELIRTLQDHGVHQGIDVHMECTALELLLEDGARSPACSPTGARPAASSCSARKAVILATGGGGKAWRITSNSWEYTGDGIAHGLRRRRRADGPGVHAVPPDRHGVAAFGARHPGHRGRARRRRHPAEQQGRALHVQLHPGEVRRRDGRHRGGGRSLARTATRTRAARPSCSPATWSRARSRAEVKAGPRLAARRRVPRHRLAAPGRVHQAQAAVDVPPVQGAGRGRHHQGADGGRADAALLHGRHPRRRRHARCRTCRACSPPASAPAGMHGANRLGGNSLSDLLVFGKLAGDGAADVRRARSAATPKVDDAQVDRGGPRARPTSLNREPGDEPVPGARRAAERDGRARRHRAHRRRSSSRASRSSSAQGATSRASRRPARASTTRAGTRRCRLRSLLDHRRGGRARRAACARRAAARTPASTSRASARSGCKYNIVIKRGRGRRDGGREARAPPERARRDARSRSRNAKIEDLEARQGRRGAVSERARSVTHGASATFRVWRGDAEGGEFDDYEVEVDPGMVVLDALHRIQAHAGQRPRGALELQGRQVRLVQRGDQRQAEARRA